MSYCSSAWSVVSFSLGSLVSRNSFARNAVSSLTFLSGNSLRSLSDSAPSLSSAVRGISAPVRIRGSAGVGRENWRVGERLAAALGVLSSSSLVRSVV